MKYIYLHGFASSPQSHKAQYLRRRFAEIGIGLKVLYLNQEDFSHLTLTRQIEQTSAIFASEKNPVTIIGSSFGGLTAAWLAEKYYQVQSLILLAPAFGFPDCWVATLTPEQIKQWRQSGYLPVYHYGAEQELPLHYEFINDACNYSQSQLRRSLPTLIIHGLKDDVIPIAASHTYAQEHDRVQLIELDSGHGLNDVQTIIWQEIKQFLDL